MLQNYSKVEIGLKNFHLKDGRKDKNQLALIQKYCDERRDLLENKLVIGYYPDQPNF